MRLVLLVLTSIICISQTLLAADFQLISDLGASAKSISIGNVEGFTDGSESVFENPAALSRVPKYGYSVFSSNVMNEVHYNSFTMAGQTPLGVMGVGFYEGSVFGIPETELRTDHRAGQVRAKDYFDYKNSIMKLSYAKRLSQRLVVGSSYNMYNNIYYNIVGSGSDMDLGALYSFNKDKEVSVFIRNLIPNSKVVYSNGATEPLRTQYVVSAKVPFKKLKLYPQYKMAYRRSLLSLGAEYKPNFMPYLTFYAGYKQHLTFLLQRKQNATFGFGLDLFGLNIHYAYERSDHFEIDHKNYFSISHNF